MCITSTQLNKVCVHACVCMGMFIPGPRIYLTRCLRNLSPLPPPSFFGAKVLQSVETFLADLEAVIGVMRSG